MEEEIGQWVRGGAWLTLHMVKGAPCQKCQLGYHVGGMRGEAPTGFALFPEDGSSVGHSGRPASLQDVVESLSRGNPLTNPSS